MLGFKLADMLCSFHVIATQTWNAQIVLQLQQDKAGGKEEEEQL